MFEFDPTGIFPPEFTIGRELPTSSDDASFTPDEGDIPCVLAYPFADVSMLTPQFSGMGVARLFQCKPMPEGIPTDMGVFPLFRTLLSDLSEVSSLVLDKKVENHMLDEEWEFIPLSTPISPFKGTICIESEVTPFSHETDGEVFVFES